MSLLLFAADLYLVGLALTVAIVVYPSFHHVGSGPWTHFHGSHVRRMAWAVAPAWFVQGVGSLWWMIDGPCRGFAVAHGALALSAVVCTVVGAVPAHQRLERYYLEQDISQLERWHWVRTSAWLGCALLALRPL